MQADALQLVDYAQYFHGIGFNVSAVGPEDKKAPSHKWKHLLNDAQTKEELLSYKWKLGTGIGAFAGINDIRCIDFDKCNNIEFIRSFLNLLDLPADYEWLVRSGSNNGFHIWIRCKDYPDASQKKVYKYPAKDAELFDHLELRLNQHIVLPPSLHESGDVYRFINVEIPGSAPVYVDISKIKQAVQVYCQVPIEEKPKVKPASTIEYDNVDEYSLFEYAVEFTKGRLDFRKSSRNDFVHLLACNCNRYGVPIELVLQEIVSRYEEPDFKEKEITLSVKSAYSISADSGKYRDIAINTVKKRSQGETDNRKENKQSNSQEANPEVENKEDSFISTGEAILSRGIQEIPTLLEPILPQVGIVALAGSSDTGKSSWLRQLAIAISLGDTFFLAWKLNLVHFSAIYVSTEDDELAINYLLNKQTRSRGLPPNKYRNLRFLFDTTSLLEKLDKELSRQPADCVIIDAFTDLYSGSLNQTNEVRTFLNKYKLLSDKHKCLFIFLHHTGKKTEDLEPSKHNLLGSQGFEAKMRLVIELRTDSSEDDVRHLCLVKGNYLSREYKQSSYVLRFDEDMLFHNTEERVPFEQLAKADEQKDTREDERMSTIFKAIELSKQGISHQKIADELKVGSKGTISKWITKYAKS